MKKLLLTLLFTSCLSVVGAEEYPISPNEKLTLRIMQYLASPDDVENRVEYVPDAGHGPDHLIQIKQVNNYTLSKKDIALIIKPYQESKAPDPYLGTRIYTLRQYFDLDDSLEESSSDDSKSRE